MAVAVLESLCCARTRLALSTCPLLFTCVRAPPTPSFSPDADEVVVDKDHGEGLSSAKPMPDYLASLLAKYLAASADAFGEGGSRSGALCDSLGALATFLGCCLFGALPLTEAEVDALEVGVMTVSARVWHVCCKRRGAGGGGGVGSMSQPIAFALKKKGKGGHQHPIFLCLPCGLLMWGTALLRRSHSSRQCTLSPRLTGAARIGSGPGARVRERRRVGRCARLSSRLRRPM